MRIMNILIIDDEKDTRQRIARLLSVSDNVLQADNGLEALNVLDREHIDLILTDICMPRMDGLELIRILRNQGSSAEIIVMSGYNDFNYAQKAIRYNVMDYLLKPISPLDLKKLVEDAKRRIAERNYREKYGYQPFMNLLLDGMYTHMDARHEMEILSLPSGFDYYATGYIRTKHTDPSALERISKALNEVAPEGIYPYAFIRGKSIALMIFVKDITETYINGILECLAEASEKEAGENLWFIFSSFSRSLDTASERDKEADFLRRTSMLDSKTEFYHKEKSRNGGFSSERLSADLKRMNEKILTLALSETSPDQIIDEFFRTLSLYARCMDGGYSEAEYWLLRLLGSLRTITENHIADEKQKEILFELDGARRIDNLYDQRMMMKRMIHHIQNEYISDNIPPSETITNTIKRRIRENIQNEAFSVQDAIEGLHYSESYIRYIFSNHEGMNIKEYITKERMEKAFELLRKGTSVKDTAEAAGFSNQRYFAKCFKDYTGLTPTEWKAEKDMP